MVSQKYEAAQSTKLMFLEHQISMISEGSFDTEGWSDGC